MPEIKHVVARHVAELLLDEENPRLPPDMGATDQDALLRFFDARYNLDELAESMVEEGFFVEEPLLTAPHPDGEHRIVVEGNRRLATLKLLLDEDARAAVDRTEHWAELADRAADKRDELDPVPTFEYADRTELLAYLGFRHVTGVVPWTAEAKARYIADHVARTNSFADTARTIGSRQDAVRRQFVGYWALRQAAEAGHNVDQALRFFGVFYRAVQSPAIRQFMHLREPSEIAEQETTPIEDGQEERVAQVSSWLFGVPGTDERAVIKDSRQITALGRILANAEATAALVEARDFALAVEVAGGDRTSIETALTQARSALIKARGQAFEFEADADIIERAQGVKRVLDDILATLGEPAEAGEDAQAAGT